MQDRWIDTILCRMSLPWRSLILWLIHLAGKSDGLDVVYHSWFFLLYAIVNPVLVTMVFKALKISLHATSVPAFALQWTYAQCLIYGLLCQTCWPQTQAQARSSLPETGWICSTFASSGYCIWRSAGGQLNLLHIILIQFHMVLHPFLFSSLTLTTHYRYPHFIYNIIACRVAFVMIR